MDFAEFVRRIDPITLRLRRSRWYENLPLYSEDPDPNDFLCEYPYYDDKSRPTYDIAVTKVVELHSRPLKKMSARSHPVLDPSTYLTDESFSSGSDNTTAEPRIGHRRTGNRGTQTISSLWRAVVGPNPRDVLTHWAIVVGDHLYEGRRGEDGMLQFCHYEVGSSDWHKNHWGRRDKVQRLGTTLLCHEQICNYGKRWQTSKDHLVHSIIGLPVSFADMS